VTVKDGAAESHILSHDQIEAALMRRAGYEVRVLPREDLGWEENPPTLLEFMRRDLRWCQGNMQYWRFLAFPGFRPVTRCQLAIAILMFASSPAWIGMLILGTLSVALAPAPASFMRADAGWALFGLVLLMWFAPKIATTADILLRPKLLREFGGPARFFASLAIETVYSILLCPIMWFSHSMFLCRLLFTRDAGWDRQSRDDHAVPLTLAMQNLWPQTLLGWAVIGALALTHPATIPFALFLAAGPALAVPIAVMTASPGLGRALARLGVGRLPEETTPPAALHALALPAIEIASPLPRAQAA
jgi:membrane glycosyltransferase